MTHGLQVLSVSLFAAAWPATATAGVVVVGPGQPFTQISSAFTTVADGDVVLVKSGVYTGFTLPGYSLAIIADAGADVVVTSTISINFNPAGRTILLDGLDVQGGLRVLNAGAAVRVQNCRLVGPDGTATLSHPPDCEVTGNANGGSGARVVNSKDVVFTRCTLQGGIGSSIWDSTCYVFYNAFMVGGYGGDGLTILGNSSATLYDSLLTGGRSGDGGNSNPAGHGVFVDNGVSLVLVNSRAVGGDGGESFDGLGFSGGSGGFGLVPGWNCQVRVLDSEFLGGAVGPGYGIPGGQLADPIAPGGLGYVTFWSGNAKVLDISSVLREGQSATMQVSGDPGEMALVYASLKAPALLVPKAKGTFMLDLPMLLGPFPLGTLASSTLSLDVPIPDLPAGVDVAEVYVQGALAGPASTTLTSWGHLTVLDATF